MARQEIHSDKLTINQPPSISSQREGAKEGDTILDDLADRVSDIVEADPSVLKKEYADRIKFMEEPVQIRLEPSTEKNAATTFPVWVNGVGAEVLLGGAWVSCTYLPVGEVVTVKRKVLEVIARAKIDNIETEVIENPGQDPNNRVKKFTSAVHSFSVMGDSSAGHAWLSELRRRRY